MCGQHNQGSREILTDGGGEFVRVSTGKGPVHWGGLGEGSSGGIKVVELVVWGKTPGGGAFDGVGSLFDSVS